MAGLEPVISDWMRKARMKKSILLFLFILTACAGKGTGIKEPLEVVSRVDITRYAGTWYEIARYPNSFQKGCTATTATYTLRDDGKISVVNRCRVDSPGGREKKAEGRAWVVDPATNAKLQVSFFWPFRGNYWIIQLDPDYRYAVVGSPSRKYLWILSRTPKLDHALYQGILEKLPEQGYDPARLLTTPHSG